jgi:hypothetical protein
MRTQLHWRARASSLPKLFFDWSSSEQHTPDSLQNLMNTFDRQAATAVGSLIYQANALHPGCAHANGRHQFYPVPYNRAIPTTKAPHCSAETMAACAGQLHAARTHSVTAKVELSNQAVLT